MLFSVVFASFMDDVAWYDCSLVLISSCCSINACFLSTKLFLLKVRFKVAITLLVRMREPDYPILRAEMFRGRKRFYHLLLTSKPVYTKNTKSSLSIYIY